MFTINARKRIKFYKKMPIKQFEDILDKIVPKCNRLLISKVVENLPGKDLDLYVKAVKSRNLKCYMYCNGARLNGDFLKALDQGIDFIRYSIIGYNPEQYRKWMNVDNFNLIISNIREAKE